MAASDLRDAFNAVSSPAYNCTQATLHYERAHDVESQVLTFMGVSAGGASFEIQSKQIQPGDIDVNAVARQTAQQLLDQGK